MRNQFIRYSLIIMCGIVLSYFIWPKFAEISMFIVFPLVSLGMIDMMQTKHTIRRNFPLIGRLRYLFEKIRPEIHQYFVESDTDGTPFNRLNRSTIYQRAKKALDTTPFGTQVNVYAPGYEWLNHSIASLDLSKRDLKNSPLINPLVGGPQCTKPYLAKILNVSAMSFGALSANAILALNKGAKIGGFAHNTGEGGISPYHLEGGGDIIWQIGTGYLGCRNKDGTFNADLFAGKSSRIPNVKMIELKLSQGAKPAHGGILPGKKVTQEIADIRLIEVGKDDISPPRHSTFETPIEMMQFIQKLRELSGGKPIGFKLCVGNKSEFFAICKAILVTGILPDFITVDGGEGGTGAAPMEFSSSVGMPLTDALAFVHDALTGFGIRNDIKIIASGKVATGFDIVRLMALGADMCNSARAMMLSLGCIQSLMCNTNKCPTGVATQDKTLQKGLVVEDKKQRVANFQMGTVASAIDMLRAAGIFTRGQLNRSLINRRISMDQVKTYEDIYPYIQERSLINPGIWGGWAQAKQYHKDMAMSDPQTFVPLRENAQEVRSLQKFYKDNIKWVDETHQDTMLMFKNKTYTGPNILRQICIDEGISPDIVHLDSFNKPFTKQNYQSSKFE